MTQDLEQEKQQRLSQKRIWIATILGFLIPITPYLYTRRWKPLLWLAGTVMGASFLIEGVAPSDNLEESFQRGRNFSPLVTLVAITDNWLAISRARKKFLGDDFSSDQ